MHSLRTARTDQPDIHEGDERGTASALPLESQVIAKSDRQDSEGNLRVNDAFLRPNLRESVTEVKVNRELFAAAKQALRDPSPQAATPAPKRSSRILFIVVGVTVVALATCAALLLRS